MQRNIYICALTVFVTLTLNAYVVLFRAIYRKKDLFELSKATLSEAERKGTEKPSERAKI